MSSKKVSVSVSILLLIVGLASAQRPPRGGAEWFDRFDADKNGTIERSEIIADADAVFKNFDRNNDGALDETEVPKPPEPPERRSDFPPPGGEFFGDAPKHPKLPPPFMMRDENRDGRVTRAEFDENVRRHFSAMDANGDGIISRAEAEAMKKDEGFAPPPKPFGNNDGFQPPAPTLQFLGAEMRFGDKLVKDAPFSAETVMENTRRLFDGSTATTRSKGAIYRDGAGRTRHEQSLETVGAFSLGGNAQKLIFITDANEGTQYFLDVNRKTVRRIPLAGSNRPPKPPGETGEAKTESLGRKVLEGVNVEGTRTTTEIPAGRIGNDKPLQIVTERWYSADLQTVVMTRHLDPLLGEQIFRLTNINRSEPARELFVVPGDYKIETDRKPR